MAVLTRNAWRHVRGALAAILVVATLAFLIAWSGAYNVAASRGHWLIAEWLLRFVMRNSVETRALAVTPPPLDDAGLVQLGASHFDLGCAPCHGAPGRPPGPVAQRMLPPAPDLTLSAERWRERELFWIVKHGIKYTGMPAWASQHRDDEVWALVAFLKALPRLDRRGYAVLARGVEQEDREVFGAERLAQARCARCHGLAQARPTSARVPVLHGQPAAFLEQTLRGYADGVRESGFMQTVANDLTAEEITALAGYYAALPMPPPAVASSSEAGRRLAMQGSPEAKLPACNSCHGADALAIYPRLAGQSADYLAGRLRLWKSGYTPVTGTAAVMAPIAQRLSERQIEEVSAYFAGLGARAETRRRP